MRFLQQIFQEQRKAKIIVFVLLFFISLTGFFRLNQSRITELEDFMESVIQSFVISSADGISVGYFQWDDMYDSVKSKDESFLDHYKHDILSTFTIVDEIETLNVPFDGSTFYKFYSANQELYLYFGIFDSATDLYIKDQMIRMKFNPANLLNQVLVTNKLNFNITILDGERVEDIQISSNENILRFFHFISAIFIGFLGIFFLHTFNKYSISSHYEIEGLANIVMLLSKKDAYTAEHSKDVAKYAEIIAKSFGMNRKQQKTLEKAGYLHDIGKIGISESILNKTGKLDEEEFNEIKKHSTIGYEIVSQFPNLNEVAIIVKHHHELRNGKGYPDGLKGDEIPLSSQILAVADVYSAMTTDRPYRRGYTGKAAFEIMEKMSLNQELVALLKQNMVQ
ncbi:MAG: HD-GYP domain-containing protein [Clostridia bacterium]|nr:HD-GYP domain-containing protein [Clostridia bacterium]